MNPVKLLFLTAAPMILAAAETAPAVAPAPAPAPAVAPTPAPAPAPAVDPLPNDKTLQRLARRAIFEAVGVRMRVGPVIIREKLPDGSYLVYVTLENGRRIRGRLFRRKHLYRIAVDRRDFFAAEIEIVK